MTPGCVAVCRGGAYWPLTTYRCPSLAPSASISGAHGPLNPLCPPPLCLAYPHLCTRPCFPLGGCANGAPGLSLFHCSVSGPHGGGQLPSPLAGCVQAGGGGGGGNTILVFERGEGGRGSSLHLFDSKTTLCHTRFKRRPGPGPAAAQCSQHMCQHVTNQHNPHVRRMSNGEKREANGSHLIRMCMLQREGSTREAWGGPPVHSHGCIRARPVPLTGACVFVKTARSPKRHRLTH